MFLLHLVFAGVIVGTLANEYGAFSAEDDQNKEHPDRRQQKNKVMRFESLDMMKEDPFTNWFLPPKGKPKKVPSTTPDVSWLEEFLSRATTESPWSKTVETTTTVTTTTSPTPTPVTRVTETIPVYPELRPSYLKRSIDILVVSVDNLSAILHDIKMKNCHNLPKNTYTRLNRRKRDVSNTESAVSVDLKSVNDTKNTSIPVGGGKSNDAASVPEFQNGRRSAQSFRSVKDKLLLYLDEGFQEIGTKVNSLWKIKQQFANVAAYKMGYIIANVDTLAVSIKNLREEARRNRLLWEEREILDVYDRLKISNSLITNLMETLRLLMEDK